MLLSLPELTDLARFLDLDIDQVQDGSLLRDRVTDLEEFDSINGTNLIQSVKDSIAELIAIELKIAEIQLSKSYGASDISVNVKDEYSHKTAFKPSFNSGSGQKARMSYLIREIRRLIKLKKPINKICLG